MLAVEQQTLSKDIVPGNRRRDFAQSSRYCSPPELSYSLTLAARHCFHVLLSPQVSDC
jgi:hypothetical protein